MKRIANSFLVGIVLSLAGWLMNWLITGYVTYAPIEMSDGGTIVFDYLLNPIILTVYVYCVHIGLDIGEYTRFGSARRSEFRVMCLITPNLMLIVITLIAGWKISLVVTPLLFTAYAFLIVCNSIWLKISRFGTGCGSN